MRYTKIIGIEDIVISLIAVKNKIFECIISGVVFFVIGILLTLNSGIDNFYSAATTLYCSVNDSAESVDTAKLISSYSSLVKSQKVAERAVSELGNTSLTYRSIQNMVSYYTSPSGVNLTISASSSNGEEAVAVANAVTDAFIEEMRNLTQTDNIQVLNLAEKSNLSRNGLVNVWKKRIAFFMVGCILMAAFVFAMELFSDKIRIVEQCMVTDDDKVLGIIPEIDEINEK